MDTAIRTRIAPSPTGFPHIGTIYQAMFDYVCARHSNGCFIVRIEDTDQRRFVHGSEEVVIESLAWFGMVADEDPVKGGEYGPYRQSERLGIYKEYVDQLLDKGHAYRCFCTQERLEEMREEQVRQKKPTMYDKRCLYLNQEHIDRFLQNHTEYVVRMKVPENETIVITDPLVGRVEFDSNLIDHQVIMKSDGFPTYHLAVVVDDHLMKITHVFRGREWLPSAPKHILLYRYFGWEAPVFIHLPLILNTDKGKLSKRHGHASVTYYKEQGYLPEAILNYMSLIVWNHPEGKEIYALDEFIKFFDVGAISSQGPRFDLQKLNWVNGEWIRSMDEADLAHRLAAMNSFMEKTSILESSQPHYLGYSHYSYEQIMRVLPLVKDRLKLLSQFDDLSFFFYEDLDIVLQLDLEKLAALQKEPENMGIQEYWKKLLTPKHRDQSEIYAMLDTVVSCLASLPDWTHTTMEERFRELVSESGWKIGELFMLIRVAVTGRTATPPLFESMEVLGREVCEKRIVAARELFR